MTGVTYRNPALLAKMVTTLDIISGGRAILGLGAAWNEDEHKGYGFDFPPMRERMDRLEEALEICHLMFTEERPSFQGTYYRSIAHSTTPGRSSPAGRRSSSAAAASGAPCAWSPDSATSPTGSARSTSSSTRTTCCQAHCEAVGRDPSTIVRTVMAPVLLVNDVREAEALMARIPPERRANLIAATPADAAEALAPYREAGFDGFILRNAMLSTVEALGLAGELIARCSRAASPRGRASQRLTPQVSRP